MVCVGVLWIDHEKNRVEVYGKPDARVGLTSIPEYASCNPFLL